MDYRSLRDETLLQLIARKDEAALEELYDRYVRLLFSVALHMVGNRSASEEIVLDVFTRIWENAGGYRQERSQATTWMTSITRYRAIDYLRRQGARPEHNSVSWEVLLWEPVSTSNPERETGLALRRQRIRSCLTQLPEEQRQVILLAYFRGLTQREIADQLELPLGTVKTRIRLGLKKLRFLLRNEQPEI